MDQNPFFSIIISTRDRPELFQTALHSVVNQDFSDREIIVVVDGSTQANLAKYDELERQYEKEITFHHLSHRENGHGQSYAMNYGVDQSSGNYLCFLDDDDQWTSDNYLSDLHANIIASPETVDVHYSNQKAIYSDGSPQTESVWIEDLIPRLQESDKNRENCYFVTTEFLLGSGGFGHLNCSVFNRDFYANIGRMDESIRYENDRDVYLRAIDEAKTILFSTQYMSLHNIPDVHKKSNMSTMSSNIEKKLYQMRVYDKGIALAQRPSIAKFCRKAKVYELKHVATILAEQKNFRAALHYARESLIGGFNLRWFAYTISLSLKVLFSASENNGEDNPQPRS
ncbi:MAG: glycosyltransferase involved in cell wall biosynthesis [Halioglobus sp.]|jgi:glycosyltransferase involved in cell wall biosynthesis